MKAGLVFSGMILLTCQAMRFMKMLQFPMMLSSGIKRESRQHNGGFLLQCAGLQSVAVFVSHLE